MALLLVVSITSLPASSVASATACPVGAQPSPVRSGMCDCPVAAPCTTAPAGGAPSAADSCTENVDGSTFFDPSGCPSCTCQLAPALYAVQRPTHGDILARGRAYNISWTASVNVTAVTLRLFFARFDSSIQATQYLPVRDISPGPVPNTGRFLWTVPLNLPTNDSYAVAVFAAGASGAAAFKTSPIFSVVELASGACPPGFVAAAPGSASPDPFLAPQPPYEAYQDCRMCPQGQVALDDRLTCSACPVGRTTTGPGAMQPEGAATGAECTVDTGSVMARFSQFRDLELAGQSYGTPTTTTLQQCATTCWLDILCKSFEYTAVDASQGTCVTSFDTRATALVHTLQRRRGRSFFEKTSIVSVLPAFTLSANSYIHTAAVPLTTHYGTHSTEACAAECVQTSQCVGFMAGTEGRAGDCFLFSQAFVDSGPLAPSATAHLSTYILANGASCPPGSVSVTGRAPCVPCARGTFSTADGQTSCTPCPSGQSTIAPGANSSALCQTLSCADPARLDQTADAADCVCPTNSDCTGGRCTSQTNSNPDGSSYSVQFYPADCADCTCSPRKDPPTIDFVFTPTRNAVWYRGFTYEITYQASSGVSQVHVAFYSDVDKVLRIIQLYAPNTGSFSWTVPTAYPAGLAYIFVYHAPLPGETPAPTHRNSNPFMVAQLPSGDCPPGAFNAATGRYPCELCPPGSYWQSPTACAPCPANTTNIQLGAQSQADCNLDSTSPLFQFAAFPNHFISGSNAAGYFLEGGLSPAECAQRCLDDRGCKSFDVGNVGDSQDGDCFLSYDNRATIRPGDYNSITQLSYFERRDMAPIAASHFRRYPGCYIKENDDGGRYETALSVESCAQLCLNDPCCKSFDAGQSGSTREYDCFLSYTSRDEALAAGSYSCGSVLYDLYERRVLANFSFPLATVGKTYTQLDLGSFRAAVLRTLQQAPSIAAAAAADIALADISLQDSTLRGEAPAVLVGLVLPDQATLEAVNVMVEQGGFGFFFPTPFDDRYVAAFSPSAGPCEPGTTSQTGARPNCQTCPANTFANRAQTKCEPCPAGTVAVPGATSVKACTKPPTSGARPAFAVGDQWLGTFRLGPSSVGALDLSVVAVAQDDPSRLTLLATVTHGQFCDAAQGCRSAGVSGYYMDAEVAGASLTAAFTRGSAGWIGITDRSYVRFDLDGTVSSGLQTVYSGSLASFDSLGQFQQSGSFSVTRRCQTTKELGTFNVTDKWIGVYQCDQRSVNGSKAREGTFVTRRMDLYIQGMAEDDTITAVVDFDHHVGSGEFFAQGKFHEGRCSSLELTPRGAGAWITRHPADVPAVQLSGQLSEDGEFFTGRVNPNPHCACTGLSAPFNPDPTRGQTCALHDAGDTAKWCYVSKECPEARPAPENALAGTDVYWAPCGPFDQCSAFSFTRVCAEPLPLCPPGWQLFDNRCYRVETAAAATSWVAAEAVCVGHSGHLASLHSTAESAFVGNLVASTFAAVSGPSTSLWIGGRAANRSSPFAWADGSEWFLEFWADGQPSAADSLPASAARCVAMATTGPSFVWSARPCEGPSAPALQYVCERPTLSVNRTCACTGASDADGLGGSCGLWSGNASEPWCYTSPHCPRAFNLAAATQTLTNSSSSNNATLWRAQCYLAPPTTTPLPPTTPQLSCHQRNSSLYAGTNGSCMACTTAADCTSAETLVGACGEFSSPICVPCDSSCATCSGPGPAACTTCAAGRLWSASRTLCLAACPQGQFADGGGQQCQPCHASCGSCVGAAANQCTSCPPTASTYLQPEDGMDSGECVAGCADGFWRNEEAKRCEVCSRCALADGLYRNTNCTSTADATCSPLSRCTPQSEYEILAPTPTSDRRCMATSICTPGQEVLAVPTPTSDRECRPCAAGTTDLDRSPATPCEPCDPGTYAPSGWRGACQRCPAGSADTDSSPATPCLNCTLGSTFQPSPEQTACLAVSICAPGWEQATPPTRISDRVCRPCLGDTFSATGGNASCQPRLVCAAGEEPDPAQPLPLAASADRQCRACPSGTFKAQAGNTPCVAATVCAAGEEALRTANASADTQCRGCQPGTFNPERCGRCQPATVCDARTQYRVVAATPISDTVCRNLTVCTAAQYVSEPASTDRNRVCADLRVCSSGQFEEQPPTRDPDSGLFVSNRICAACSSCPAAYVQRACSATNDTVCGICEPCEAGVTYESQACGGSQPRLCTACSACVLNQTYAAEPCTVTANTDCRAVTVCRAGAEFELAPPTLTSDRKCQALTVCGAGTEEDRAPTATSDRTCRPCQPGLTYRGGAQGSSTTCQPVTACAAGYVETAAPTLTSDRICAPCNLAREFAAGARVCANLTVCGVGEAETLAATATSDRACAPCAAPAYFQDRAGQTSCKTTTRCGAGEYAATQPTASSDRLCRPCPTGSFQSVSNHSRGQCEPLSVCGLGETLLRDGNATHDRLCQPCADGRFKDVLGSSACLNPSTCGAGEEERAAPTPSSDRQCQACIPGVTFKPLPGQSTRCQAVRQCPAGQEQAEDGAPTVVSNRVCAGCAAGTFKPLDGPGRCLNHSATCAAGFRESRAPSATADRQCTACVVENGEFQPRAGQTECAALTVCAAGTFVAVEATAVRDRQCEACPAGQVSTSFNAPSCVACEAGFFQALPGQLSCTAWSVCGPGSAVVQEPSATRDRLCGECPPGTFAEGANAPQCQPCPPGAFQSDEGRDSCQAWSEPCPAGLEQTQAPSTTSDRQCTACVLGQNFKAATGAGRCQPVSNCTADKQVAVAATLTADTVCSCIPGVTFQAAAVFDPRMPCMAVRGVCSAQETEFLAPSLSMDRLCVPAGSDGQTRLVFAGDFAALSSPTAFGAELRRLIWALPKLQTLIAAGLHMRMEIKPGSIVADLALSKKEAVPVINEAALLGLLQFEWPPGSGQNMTALYCPPGLYAAADASTCLPCAAGETSQGGALSQTDCFVDQNSAASVGGGSGVSLWIIVAAAGGALLIALAIVFAAVHRRRRQMAADFASPKLRYNANVAGETEFSNPLYEARQALGGGGGAGFGEGGLDDDAKSETYGAMLPAMLPLAEPIQTEMRHGVFGREEEADEMAYGDGGEDGRPPPLRPEERTRGYMQLHTNPGYLILGDEEAI